MISQNRADVKRQVLADHQWDMIQAGSGRISGCWTFRRSSWH